MSWWVIEDEQLLMALRRCGNGEDPDMVYTELYANTRVDKDCDPGLVILKTAEFYGLPVTALIGPSRVRTIAHARHVAIFLIRQLTSMTLNEVKSQFGQRDFSTVYDAVAKIKRLIVEDPSMGPTLTLIREQVKNAQRDGSV